MITIMAGAGEIGMRICTNAYTCSDVFCVRCIAHVSCKLFQWPTTCIFLQLGRYFFLQNSHSITFVSEITQIGHMWAGISGAKPSQSQWNNLSQLQDVSTHGQSCPLNPWWHVTPNFTVPQIKILNDENSLLSGIVHHLSVPNRCAHIQIGGSAKHTNLLLWFVIATLTNM